MRSSALSSLLLRTVPSRPHCSMFCCLHSHKKFAKKHEFPLRSARLLACNSRSHGSAAPPDQPTHDHSVKHPGCNADAHFFSCWLMRCEMVRKRLNSASHFLALRALFPSSLDSFSVHQAPHADSRVQSCPPLHQPKCWLRRRRACRSQTTTAAAAAHRRSSPHPPRPRLSRSPSPTRRKARRAETKRRKVPRAPQLLVTRRRRKRKRIKRKSQRRRQPMVRHFSPARVVRVRLSCVRTPPSLSSVAHPLCVTLSLCPLLHSLRRALVLPGRSQSGSSGRSPLERQQGGATPTADVAGLRARHRLL